MTHIPLPGTPQHQALLQHFVNYYADDPRVLAIIVLGSLGRGNWDALSDLDLDVVITDDAHVSIDTELQTLCDSFASLNERAAIIFPEGSDEGEIVLESLMMLSIRYHTLADTNYSIVDSMRVLWGKLDHETIAAAGIANRKDTPAPLAHLLDRLVRYTAVASVYHRRAFHWGTMEMLHLMRGIFMQIFARTHGGVRPYHTFQAKADPQLQVRLGMTLPQLEDDSVKSALLAMLDVIEKDLAEISNGALALTPGQQAVLTRVRAVLG